MSDPRSPDGAKRNPGPRALHRAPIPDCGDETASIRATKLSGRIAPAWPTLRLGDVCKFVSGGTPKKDDPSNWGGNVPWVTPKDMKRQELSGASLHISREACASSAVNLIDAGAVLVLVRGMGLARGWPVCVLRVAATFNQDIKALTCGPEMSPDFLAWALRCQADQVLASKEVATHGTLKLGTGLLASLKIPVPPLSEQKRIAARLTEQMAAVDRARVAAQAKLDALKALPAAYVRESFESLAALGTPHRSLGELCAGSGVYGTSRKSNPEQRGVPILRMGDIVDGELRSDNLTHVEVPESELRKFLLQPGDLVFNRTNSAELVGKTAVFTGSEPTVFASYLIRFRLRPDVADPNFVSRYINSEAGRAFVKAHMGRAIGQVNISASTMTRMKIPCPSIAVQRALSSRVEAQIATARTAIVFAESELAAVNALPAALLRRAFGGELSAQTVERGSLTQSTLRLRAACAALNALRWGTQRKRSGKTKLAKAQALAQTRAGLALTNPLLRYPHGPYDPEFDAVIAHAVEQEWLRACELPGFNDPVYEAGPRIEDALSVLDAAAGPLRADLEALADLMLEWDRDRAERVATLFTAWNDLLIEGRAADASAVVDEVLHHWHAEKARKFTPQALHAELDWMRRQELVPQGKGPRTEGGQGSLDFARDR